MILYEDMIRKTKVLARIAKQANRLAHVHFLNNSSVDESEFYLS